MIIQKPIKNILLDLNITDETTELEVKHISGLKLGKSFLETVCSFSNEPALGGGTILLGVKREEDASFPFYEPIGLENPDKISNDITTSCQGSFSAVIRPIITIEKIDGNVVMKVDIPEAPNHLKPVYIKKKGMDKGSYRRIGTADVLCTDEDLSAIFSTKSGLPFDSEIVEECDWDDLEPTAIQMYRTERREFVPTAEELNWTDEDLVYSLRGVKKQNDEFIPTVAGMLLFGKQKSLRRVMPSHRVDYIRVAGRAWVENPEKRFDSIEMRGPAISIIQRVIATILDDLPSSFSLKEDSSGQREDVPALPTIVIREAVVNAIMHRSYKINQPVQIIRYSNRLEIRNPGFSLKSENSFDDPGSHTRNPQIAEVLHEARFSENKGSGVRVMKAKMIGAGLAPPTFKSDKHTDSFQAIFLFHHFLNDDDLKWLSHFKSLKLSDEQLRALIFVREVEAIDNKSFRDMVGLDTLKASKQLTALRDLDLIAEKATGSQMYYVAGSALISHINMRADSHSNEPNSHSNAVGSHGKENKQAAGGISFEDLPQELKTGVRQVTLMKRVPPDLMREMIVRLCAWKQLSAKEISEIIRRGQTYVQQSILAPMVDDGQISYTHPQMTNHPNQKYKVPE